MPAAAGQVCSSPIYNLRGQSTTRCQLPSATRARVLEEEDGATTLYIGNYAEWQVGTNTLTRLTSGSRFILG
jgi:hypothetical protein